MPKAIEISFDKWPARGLFTNEAGNTLHWGPRNELRHEAREEAYWRAYNRLDKPFEKATIDIFVTAGDRRRRDLDSVLSACKSWVDGLVLAGIIKDDNYFCIPRISITFQGVGKENVTIVVSEVTDG
ncbi:hypothetical protein LCGC14_2790130 [marine sediment metagenome]|uniref:Uncharacterized protein n=1 Tax=marine sediment metagenome TaxID=412755 RepID=A0A0F9BH42_9ZZZZ